MLGVLLARAVDPRRGLVGVLLTDTAWSSPAAPALVRDFWTCAYAAVP